MEKNFLLNGFFLSASLLLSLILILSYFLLSNDQLFIPLSLQQQFSFNLFSQPLSAFSFMFIHTGIAHLTANVLLVLFFGRIVERKIQKKHVFGIFFIGGILSFSLFNFFEPNIFGIGASGGAIALTTAGLLLSPKKSFFALIGIALISLLLMFGVNQYQLLLEQNLQEQKQVTENQLQKAITEKNPVAIQIQTQKLEKISKNINEKEQHRQYEKEMKIANFVHFFASIVALGYLFFFCPKQTKKAIRKNLDYLKGKLSRNL